MCGGAEGEYGLRLQSGGRLIRGTISGTGAALRHLSVGGVDLTPGFDGHAPFYCGKVLVPWPNRVRDGRWVHRGRTRQLDITDPEHRTALHGLLCATDYHLVARSTSEVTLGAPVRRSAGYPFDLDTTVEYRLTPDGLRTTHTVRNTGSTCAPVALGAHPFLSIGDVPTDELTLTVPGRHHIDVDDRRVPVGASPVEGTEWDLRTGRTVADLTLDDCWAVSCEANSGSTHTLRAPDGRTVSLWADERFGFLHVFVTREFPRGDRVVTAIALEPMTAPADALNSGKGIRWLRPADSLSASWAVRYDDTGSGTAQGVTWPHAARRGTAASPR